MWETPGEFPLDGNNLLMVRTHWNSVALENVTVSNDSSETFELSNLEIIPDWGTFTGFDTRCRKPGHGNWTFNVTHRGFHTLLDPDSQEPTAVRLAKVEKDTNFVELAYNPFANPSAPSWEARAFPPPDCRPLQAWKTLFNPLPRR